MDTLGTQPNVERLSFSLYCIVCIEYVERFVLFQSVLHWRFHIILFATLSNFVFFCSEQFKWRLG